MSQGSPYVAPQKRTVLPGDLDMEVLRRPENRVTPYQPLDSSQQDIRLLWLSPSNNGDSDNSPSEPEIQLTLTRVSLFQKPAYHALSYAWGDPCDPVHRIRLNGTDFEVRSNLYDCLVHLRRRGTGCEQSGVPLWIDAVCINQADVAEKNGQLRLMGDIYRRATSVISWLGSAERLVHGVGSLAEIAREWVRLKEELAAVPASTSCDDGPHAPTLADRKRAVPRDRLRGWLRETAHIWREDYAGLRAMVYLFHSSYWKRVWIAQELLLADPETHVYVCGTASFTEAQLDALADCILVVSDGDKPEEVDDGVWVGITLGLRGELGQRAMLSAVQFGLVTPSLMFVLLVANTRSATDPRDVVYGLLHLIPGHGIVPDYRRAVWEVYAEWASQAMLEQGNLELLAYVTAKEEHRPHVELDLPSWVPDICNYKGYRGVVDWVRRGKGVEDTGGGADGNFAVELSQNGRVLGVEGRRGDTVMKVTQFRPILESHGEWRSDMVRFCIDYLAAQRASGRAYPTGIPPLQALLRLVMQPRLDALSPAEYPKGVHRVAVDFIDWLLVGFEGMFPGDHPDNKETFETTAMLLGPRWFEDFPEAYAEAVFPGVDVRELMGWNELRDALPWVNESAGRDESDESGEAVNDYMRDWCDGPRLMETEEGYLGCGPRNAEPGDHIVMVKHCTSPLVFRDLNPESGCVTLLGYCELVGFGDGKTAGDAAYEKFWIA